MAHQTISFRSQTRGEVSDLIEEEGLVCQASQNLLSSLAGAILSYREEGVELTPTILFCQEADVVINALPGAVQYQIGTAVLTPEAAKRILKECAPLAVDGWHIWIERVSEEQIRYGVFSYLVLPTTPPLTETLTVLANAFAVIMRRLSRTTVDIVGARGNGRSLVFSTTREEALTSDPLEDFARSCCAGLDESERGEFGSYIRQLLDRCLSASHGAILICSSPSLLDAPGMADGIALTPTLDFLTAFRDYRTFESADAILKMQALEALLRGFLNSDGIVAFTNGGEAFAYRVFYRGDVPAGDAPVGGARRRAFAGVASLIPEHASAALFRSQDGMMIFSGAPNV